MTVATKRPLHAQEMKQIWPFAGHCRNQTALMQRHCVHLPVRLTPLLKLPCYPLSLTAATALHAAACIGTHCTAWATCHAHSPGMHKEEDTAVNKYVGGGLQKTGKVTQGLSRRAHQSAQHKKVISTVLDLIRALQTACMWAAETTRSLPAWSKKVLEAGCGRTWKTPSRVNKLISSSTCAEQFVPPCQGCCACLLPASAMHAARSCLRRHSSTKPVAP